MIKLSSRELEFELIMPHFIAVALHAQPTTFRLLHSELHLSATGLEAKHIIRPQPTIVIEVPIAANYFDFVILTPSIAPIELLEPITSSTS